MLVLDKEFLALNTTQFCLSYNNNDKTTVL
jgi:hypothetical protein